MGKEGLNIISNNNKNIHQTKFEFVTIKQKYLFQSYLIYFNGSLLKFK
jgi:hypothetical protein